MNPSYPSNSVRVRPGQDVQAGHAPSVPLSVYRELAAELQATKAMVDSLSTQNQHLSKQNQLMRQEIHRVVQTTLQLGQYAGVAHPAEVEPELSAVPAPGKPAEPRQSFKGQLGARPPKPPAPKSPAAHPPVAAEFRAARRESEKAGALVPKFFTEQSGEKRRPGLGSNFSKEMNGLWLMLSIFLIVFTAFGAGFLIMRPLLSGDR
jgi:hypothetical protein